MEAQLEVIKQRALTEELRGVRVVAQARTAERARLKGIADKAIAEEIKASKLSIDLLIAQSSFKKKTLEEDLVFTELIYEKEIEALDLQLKRKKISQEEYNIAVLELDKELNQKKADVLVKNAEFELNEFIKTNQSKIDNEQFFSDESLRIEQERIKKNFR